MSKRRKIEAILAGGVLAYAITNLFIIVVNKHKSGINWDKAFREMSR